MRIELIESKDDLPEDVARSLTPEEVQARKKFYLNQKSDWQNLQMRKDRCVLVHITEMNTAPTEYWEFWQVSEATRFADPV